jgi:periplasmic protein TonB
MATLTFDQSYAAPRPYTVRKRVRAPVQVVDIPAPPPQETQRRTSAASIVLVGAIVALHAFAVVSLSGAKRAAAPAPAPKPIMISLAPPKAEVPPPPPPKPQPPAPRVKAPAPVRPAPPAAPAAPAVASEVPLVAPSAETVQVAQAPAAAPAPVPAEEPVTEPRGYAGYLRNPAPDYPLAAQKRGLEGKVVLKVHVLASGQPDSVTVASSSGHQILDEAALKAVLQWAFAPARRGQKAIDGWVQVPLNFKI